MLLFEMLQGGVVPGERTSRWDTIVLRSSPGRASNGGCGWECCRGISLSLFSILLWFFFGLLELFDRWLEGINCFLFLGTREVWSSGVS